MPGRGEAYQAKPEILCHVSVIFMQIRQMTRNIWIKKRRGVGGGLWEGVGLPVLYLQDGVNKTEISRVRPNLSFLSPDLPFFPSEFYIINNLIKDNQTSATQVSPVFYAQHCIWYTFTVPRYKYTKIPRLGFPGVKHVIARAVFRANLSKTVNLDVLYWYMLLEISRSLQSILWPLVRFLVGYVLVLFDQPAPLMFLWKSKKMNWFTPEIRKSYRIEARHGSLLCYLCCLATCCTT